MPQTKTDAQIMQDACARFKVAAAQLGLSDAELSRKLGYNTPNTVLDVKRGKSWMKVDRLCLLAELRTPDGRGIDLHWLITGNEYRRQQNDV